MDKISEAIEKFAQRERDEAEKACKEEKNQVSINPDSYIAKEIKYQTALIHGMQEEMRLLRNEIKRDRETNSPPRSSKKIFVFKGKWRRHK